MRRRLWGALFLAFLAVPLATCRRSENLRSLAACKEMAKEGLRDVARDRKERFLGKVAPETALCRGGDRAAEFRDLPWVDWQNYWASGDATSKSNHREAITLLGSHLFPDGRGLDGALLDLEYQRLELIKFNLFDNATFEHYLKGRDGVDGPALRVWKEMRLPPGHPLYRQVGGDADQVCRGDLIRHRTMEGICNDIFNPLMGSSGTLFGRNVMFEATFPELGADVPARNRHGDRIGLMRPDPQVISRVLFTRAQSDPQACAAGQGRGPGSACDYKKAPFFNVLAAFWIQFMTHDWFSHLQEGRNAPEMIATGCGSRLEGDRDRPLSPQEASGLGCRPDDRVDRSLVADQDPPRTIRDGGSDRLARAHRTTRNFVTAWWDASQIYGFDETSVRRVKRDPSDRARLLMVRKGSRSGEGEKLGYLPTFETCEPARAGCVADPITPSWVGQEAAAFADNWSIGMSFYHNLFVREHNVIVDEFRRQTAATPDRDSGLRDPARPEAAIAYRDVTADELYEVARLIVSAEIAKIHTIEWTPQLLYDEPLHVGMNGNWSGILGDQPRLAQLLEKIMVNSLGTAEEESRHNQLYSAFAAGPGIFGLGSRRYAKQDLRKEHDLWSAADPEHVNGGVNHFGSPFNFPEEFVSVYRLHPLVPDLIEYRRWDDRPNEIKEMLPVIATFRGRATGEMESRGLANLALSMGRQRLGALTLQNHPMFLQNLPMPRLNSATNLLDVAALDILRDRERGVPRFNEFRRQIGLRQLRSFDDFVDHRLPPGPERAEQERLAGLLRQIYGQHRCDASRIITEAQYDEDHQPINDCLGHPDGSLVDNVEDVDTVVGYLAEFARPHGFAISETQFQIFIINASRRLFSDRFFTSSFRPEFYSHFGVEWVTNNGPSGRRTEPRPSNGHEVEVSPLKRVMLRAIPELKGELDQVVNMFDPWARDRGDYYSLQWKPRADAASDPAFR